MAHTMERTETAYDFLLRKGLRKVHQPNKRYNLTIAELVEFLNEFAGNAAHRISDPGYFDQSSDFRYRISEII